MIINVEHEYRHEFGEDFRDMPDLPITEFEKVRRLLDYHYVFYRKEGARRRGFCTCCGNEMYAGRELIGSGDFLEDLWAAKHKTPGHCPICHYPVKFLAEGFYKDYSSLEHYENVIFILPSEDGQTVWFRAFVVFVDYSTDHGSRMCFVEKSHYKLTPGAMSMEIRSFPVYDYYFYNTLAAHKGHYDYACYGLGKWNKVNKPSEPFRGFMYYTPFYYFLELEKLENTFLRYARVMDFDRVSPIRGKGYYTSSYGSTKLMQYLCYYALYPSLEIAMRTGGQEAARELVYLGRKNSHIVNWKAKDPFGFWKVDRSQWKNMRNINDKLEFMRDIKKHMDKMPFSEICEIYKVGRMTCESFFVSLDMLPAFDYKTLYKYFKRNERDFFAYYRDYLEAAQALGRDLSVYNVAFPKDFKQAHDSAIAAREYKENQKLYTKYKRKYEEREKLYTYADEHYMISVARTGAEIVQEGNNLHHCVGGYVDRHLKCQTTILFLRETEHPEKSLYTVQMNDRTPVQCHGDRNCEISGEALEFYQRWLKWVEAGGGFNKSKIREEISV